MLRLNKKGNMAIIIGAISFSICIAIIYIILITHSLDIENKNKLDCAVNNAATTNIDILESDYSKWHSVFTQVLKDNYSNVDTNYMLLITKSDKEYSMYKLGSTKTLVQDNLDKDTVKSILSAYTTNSFIFDRLLVFDNDNKYKTCLLINKNINTNINKDYIYLY